MFIDTLKKLELPKAIHICEVAPRDGFQALDQWLPTEQKVAIVKKLATTGIRYVEITSFVHPKAIPQLRDAAEVVEACQGLENMHFQALVPNLIGAQRAIDAGLKKIKLMLSATDSHSISNANSKTEDAQKGFFSIVELATKHGVAIKGSISVAFGCPFEGKVPTSRISQIVQRYVSMGVEEISLADSSGAANPKLVYDMLGELSEIFPTVTFSMHFHNTRGLAFANAVAAMQQGITHFDSSVAALGGCPYIPGASGNIGTEDLVHGVHEMGIETGIDLDKLLEVAKEVKQIVGFNGGSYILRAGPLSQLAPKLEKQEKVGE
ncbi:hydroxymethylglutaryl-CoA lyase [Bacillus horti]|uniref:Hydroxymethylglutaryl-CoA lyase n=1 Tax=Caldalkalibacillus horti TaxID=77523 RepID=A0ABT9W1M7_9BACI|nr:hydroxymethylglutaryl-CoA lyase [Bacillus horti]MDQ0166984.1 hydroxymethylglutaryl-CoA lyase [Bacillus horti]